MKFIVNSLELANNVQALAGVLNSKNTLPILDHIIFEIGDKVLNIYASDNETIVRCNMPLDNVDGEGKVAMPARLLLDILKALPDGSTTFQVKDNRIEITAGRGQYHLTGMSTEGFPDIPEVEAIANMTLTIDTLTQAINKTIFATGNDEMRPMMSGVSCNLLGHDVVFVATDAHKLVRYTRRNVSEEEHVQTSFILPKKPLTLIKNIIGKRMEDAVSLRVSDKNAIFEMDNMLVSCRLIEGTFPDYERVIPKTNPNVLTIDRKILLNVVRRVSIFANKSTYSIRLKVTGQELLISAEDLEYDNAADERLSCSYAGEDIEIGFNSRILTEMLNNLEHDEISLQMSEPSRAGIIIPAGADEDEDILMLIMPVMLNT